MLLCYYLALGGKWIKKDEKEEEIYLIKKAIQKTTKKLMKHVKIPQQPMNNDSDVDDDDSTYGDVEVVPEVRSDMDMLFC